MYAARPEKGAQGQGALDHKSIPLRGSSVSFYIAENNLSLWRVLGGTVANAHGTANVVRPSRSERSGMRGRTIDTKIRNLHACTSLLCATRREECAHARASHVITQMYKERKWQDNREKSSVEKSGEVGKRREEKTPARLRGLAFTK